jgi:protein phosphatase PTC7
MNNFSRLGSIHAGSICKFGQNNAPQKQFHQEEKPHFETVAVNVKRHKQPTRNRLPVFQGTTQVQDIGHRGISFNESTKYFHGLGSRKEYETRKLKVPTQPINKYSLFCAAMASIHSGNHAKEKIPDLSNKNDFADPDFKFRPHTFSYIQAVPRGKPKVRKFGYRLKNKQINNPGARAVAAFAQNSTKESEKLPENEVQTSNLPNISKLYTVGCGLSKNEDPNKYVTSNDCIQTTNFSRNFGEDSAFVSETDSADIMGVCDGVGGWNRHGIDPAQFSKHLGHFLEKFSHDKSFKVEQPVQLLSRAYNQLFTMDKLFGSATACIATFCRKTEKLYTANLGDSGWLVIRNGKVVGKSDPQCHVFNAPYQLSKTPKGPQFQNSFSDTPSKAAFNEFQCEQGDIIVIASDGMFDNIFEEDIIKLLKRLNLGNPKEHFKTTEVIRKRTDSRDSGNESDGSSSISSFMQILTKGVQTLVEFTRIRANDRNYESPFQKEAAKHNKSYNGGKVDDITILVSVVGPKQMD